MRLARRGDPRAFEGIFERYHQELYRYCLAILGNREDAQDALQGTMLAAVRALPGETRPVALRAWLYRVAHNESISVVRRRAEPFDPDRAFEAIAPPAAADAEARERLRELVADLRSLPDRQRGALVMRELNGLGYDEIAASLQISGAAARQAVYEARLALRQLEEGREMECDRVRRALAERDGRVVRGRRIRAHLRVCKSCEGFGTGIARRRADLQSLCPPLSAVAATRLLRGLIEGGGTAGSAGAAGSVAAAGSGSAGSGSLAAAGSGSAGAVGGGAAGSGSGALGAGVITAHLGAKAGPVLATLVLGAGAAGVTTGAIHVPLGGGGRSSPATDVANLVGSHHEVGAPSRRDRRCPPGRDCLRYRGRDAKRPRGRGARRAPPHIARMATATARHRSRQVRIASGATVGLGERRRPGSRSERHRPGTDGRHPGCNAEPTVLAALAETRNTTRRIAGGSVAPPAARPSGAARRRTRPAAERQPEFRIAPDKADLLAFEGGRSERRKLNPPKEEQDAHTKGDCADRLGVRGCGLEPGRGAGG